MKAQREQPAAEIERMMKLQDVPLKEMAKKITWWEAAEIIGVTDRAMRRWRERLEAEAIQDWLIGGKVSRATGEWP